MDAKGVHLKFKQREQEGEKAEVLVFCNGNYDKFQELSALVTLLKACGKQKDLYKGSRLHADILKRGLLKDNIYVGSTLVNMYAKCGEFVKAQQVLDELPVRNVVSWNALIGGYTQFGLADEALICFEKMRREAISPNTVTLACILKACSSLGAAQKGEEIHAEIVRQGFLEKSSMVGNALVNMYATCGALVKAREVFNQLPVQDVVSWTALIAGYTQHGYSEEALNCFDLMQNQGLFPNAVTFTCILKACGSIGAVKKGEEIHAEVVRKGLLGQDVVLCNALLDMYAKCGALVKAQRVFEELPVRDVVSWTALIAGYTQHGHGEEALNCYERMQSEGFSPNAVTFACVLKACGSILASEKGEKIHAEIAREGLLGKDYILGNALVDMYAKCNSLVKAQQVFDKLPVQDVVSWNALIAGLIQHGHGAKALKCFECMQNKGLSPDAVTYTCMVDVFARAGHFDKVMTMIRKTPYPRDLVVWFVLLSACRAWGNVKLGRLAFEHAVKLDEKAAVAYVCMSNMYAAAGMQEEADNMEALRIKIEAWKKPALCWWTDLSGNVQSFCVGDQSHSQSQTVYAKVEDISHKVSQEGYCPNVDLVLQDILKQDML